MIYQSFQLRAFYVLKINFFIKIASKSLECHYDKSQNQSFHISVFFIKKNTKTFSSEIDLRNEDCFRYFTCIKEMYYSGSLAN